MHVEPRQGQTPAVVEPPQSSSPKVNTKTWFDGFCYCVPADVREAFLNSMDEDRGRMAADGYARWQIECATGLQLLILVGGGVKNLVLKFARAATGPFLGG